MKSADDLQKVAQQRLDAANLQPDEFYQEYLISIILRQRDTPRSINKGIRWVKSCLKAKTFKNPKKVKHIEVLPGTRRSPEQASLELWMDM